MPPDSVPQRLSIPETGPILALSVDSSVAFLYSVVDDIIALFGSEPYTDAITSARAEYDHRRGRVFEDEALWETWSQAFLEWYVFERDMGQAVPAAQYLANLAESDADADSARRRAAVRAWLTSYRSLFEVSALRQGTVELVDLLGGGQFSVTEQRAMAGVSAGDVAELRLVGFESTVRFGKTFCFHPAGTREAIIKHARHLAESGRSRRDIMDLCAKLRIRCERYRHVSPVRIYETSPSTLQRASGPMAAVSPEDDASPAGEDAAQ